MQWMATLKLHAHSTWCHKCHRELITNGFEHMSISMDVTLYCMGVTIKIWLALDTPSAKVSISWLYPCNKSSYIRFVYSQYHVDWLKCTDKNVNNQNLTQVSQLYVHVSFCLKVIRSWHNLPIGGHGHVICMLDQVDIMGASTADIFYNSIKSKKKNLRVTTPTSS